MMKAFLLSLAYMVCTIPMGWGCVSGAGPSWEISKPGRGRGRPKGLMPMPGVAPRPGPGGPLGRKEPSRPRIPEEVARYFGGLISKEEAFASIDLDNDGQVAIDEWIVEGGTGSDYLHMLRRLDANGDDMISLDELQPFSLPNEPVDRTLEEVAEIPTDIPLERPRPGSIPREPIPRIPRPYNHDNPRAMLDPRYRYRFLPRELQLQHRLQREYQIP
nr:uncharacterized protein LOC129271501 [Lytechinus pictus]